MRTGLAGLCIVATLSGCGGGHSSRRATGLDNRKLQTDIAVVCHDVAKRAGGLTAEDHAALQRDATGLIQLLRDPDTANPRRDTRRSIELSIEYLRGCDAGVAAELEHELTR